ncbi:MAG TPA: hypothetical protein VFZ09_45590 [Archangium sp.]|nr:hypothetical protein [Archangium sp.]HEX5753554.1 hypothetical protein [Archangium sp.]
MTTHRDWMLGTHHADFVDTPDQVSAAIQRQRLKRGTQVTT